jgi:hypothetical protein
MSVAKLSHGDPAESRPISLLYTNERSAKLLFRKLEVEGWPAGRRSASRIALTPDCPVDVGENRRW